MRKKLLSLALALAMCLGLVACGHTHVWQDATCTAPKTCAECGETEGGTLEHSWTDATCAVPKTCAVCGATEGGTLEHEWTDATCAAPKTCTACGATEGEALAHTLGEANYQSPAVCGACGEAVGEPLAAAFESGELDKSNFHLAELGATYDYHIVAYDDHSVEQTNHVTFEDYRVITSDDTHAARDGYEWQIIQVHFLSDDATVGSLGWSAVVAYYDYYSGIELPDSDTSYTVNYNGIDYECRSMLTATDEWSKNRTVNDCKAEFAAQVPIGYDGVVVGALERFSGDALEQEYPNIADLSETSLHYVRLGV